LRDEIADTVILYNPTTLKQAYKLAKQIEKSLESHTKLFKSAVKPNYQLPTAPLRIPKTNTDKSNSLPSDLITSSEQSTSKPLTIDQKRTLGLCFKCGDKFFPGHKCKIKGIHLLEVDENEDSEDIHNETTFNSQSQSSEPDSTGVITMCSSISPQHSTLKFKGKIESLDVIALVDSGSTHSFINPTIVHALSLTLTTSPPLTVKTASGHQLTTNTLCYQLPFTLQSHSFIGNFQVLQVAGHDIILGMDWIHAHSPFKINSDLGQVSIMSKGIKVKLHIQPISTEFLLCESEINIANYTNKGHQMFVAHLFSVEITYPPVPDTKVQSVLDKFKDLFLEPTSLPPSRSCDHQINLIPSSKTINLRPYRFSHFQKLELEKILAELQKNGFIQPSTSCFASPVLLVKKKRWIMEALY
jgi:Retroviral aspartyl protease